MNDNTKIPAQNLIEIADVFSTICAEVMLRRMGADGDLSEMDANEKIDLFEIYKGLGRVFGTAILTKEYLKMKEEYIIDKDTFESATKYYLEGLKKAKKEILK